MDIAAIYLVAALGAGGLAMAVKLPPLVGFLVAGFGLNAAGVEEMPGLQTLADLGVTLLLFGIGLKLDLRSLVKPRVWATAVAHMGFSVLIGLAALLAITPLGFTLVAETDLGDLAIVALALSFSSTVFVIKILDERGDNQTLYGRIAIGVLIMQDIVAAVVLTVSKGKVPSPWALALVLVVPGVWLVGKAWDRITSVELAALFGLTMALVPGYVLFELVGLKGDLGALLLGALLAGHRRAAELSRMLFTGKEVLLIAFFVSIGLTGTPTWEAFGIAALLNLLIPVKIVAFFGLLWAVAAAVPYCGTDGTLAGQLLRVRAHRRDRRRRDRCAGRGMGRRARARRGDQLPRVGGAQPALAGRRGMAQPHPSPAAG
ncbi:cation:proton antiporter [Saccharomonospora sp. CUA-673]|uniref:cation:proton antiporter domain-containing protein n=1 Tax=Saccharomonospora sp. CUA-673 TaxID=1904969 RepID=UPI001C9E9BA3|nr:cation:proton antiporter [Saccharomonospora sp. CUA-673]